MRSSNEGNREEVAAHGTGAAQVVNTPGADVQQRQYGTLELMTPIENSMFESIAVEGQAPQATSRHVSDRPRSTFRQSASDGPSRGRRNAYEPYPTDCKGRNSFCTINRMRSANSFSNPESRDTRDGQKRGCHNGAKGKNRTLRRDYAFSAAEDDNHYSPRYNTQRVIGQSQTIERELMDARRELQNHKAWHATLSRKYEMIVMEHQQEMESAHALRRKIDSLTAELDALRRD
uniref:Uncharacterized protein n=1 Tax=Psilocybe cubensis TaxID=181762 RepID=A0A8H7XN41_PSICU